ncbi:MAG: nucleoside deaminase [Bacilli bacterium]
MNNNLKYMQIAIKEAKKAAKRGDVPVGAVIVYKNKIIAKAHNKKQLRKNSLKHAELLVINKACKKLKTWHLDECTIYVTLEPCMMCTGAIIESRIKKIYYATKSDKYGSLNKITEKNKTKMQINEGICKKESIDILKKFFKEKRK